MYNRSGIDTYRQTDAHTMTREKLIVLLYEKITGHIKAAKASAADKDRLLMTKHLNKSQAIITDLRNALDHNIGGEITRNLESLYDFMFHEHLQMLVDLDPVHMKNCLYVVTPLLESWRKIPIGTGEQAARDLARGTLRPASGLNRASEGRNDSLADNASHTTTTSSNRKEPRPRTDTNSTMPTEPASITV